MLPSGNEDCRLHLQQRTWTNIFKYLCISFFEKLLALLQLTPASPSIDPTNARDLVYLVPSKSACSALTENSRRGSLGQFVRCSSLALEKLSHLPWLARILFNAMYHSQRWSSNPSNLIDGSRISYLSHWWIYSVRWLKLIDLPLF